MIHSASVPNICPSFGSVSRKIGPTQPRKTAANPNSAKAPEAQYQIAAILYKQLKNSTKAALEFALVAQRYPKHVRAADGLYTAGVAHLQTENFPAARKAFAQLVSSHPESRLADGDFLDLDWTPGTRGPVVLLLHGLEGSSDSPYARGMLEAIHAHGWRGAVMHFRGCSGVPNRLPRSYHSGDTGDLSEVVDGLTARSDVSALVVVGYLVWLPSAMHWLKNGLPLTFTAIALTALCSGLLLRQHWTEMKAFLRGKWRVILIGEAVFGLAFLLFVGIRVLDHIQDELLVHELAGRIVVLYGELSAGNTVVGGRQVEQRKRQRLIDLFAR